MFFSKLVLFAGRAYRVLFPWTRCHAQGANRGTCTKLGSVAAATYGIAALPYLLALQGECSHEHHSR